MVPVFINVLHPPSAAFTRTTLATPHPLLSPSLPISLPWLPRCVLMLASRGRCGTNGPGQKDHRPTPPPVLQTGVGNASSFDGRVPASVPPPPPAWPPLNASDVFVLRFSGGLPGPVAFAAWTTIPTCGLNVTASQACGPAGTGESTRTRWVTTEASVLCIAARPHSCPLPPMRCTPGEDACLALGCCFDEVFSACSYPQAFGPSLPPAEQCSATGSQRWDCGFYGIGHDECVTQRGCCWDSSVNPDGPQCFNATFVGTVNASFAVAPAAANACFSLRDVYGYSRGSTCAEDGVVSLTLTDGPLYLL